MSTRPPVLELTPCPECGQAAEIEWRCVLGSTDAPLEHVKIRCVQRHWFLLPTAFLAGSTWARPTSEVPR